MQEAIEGGCSSAAGLGCRRLGGLVHTAWRGAHSQPPHVTLIAPVRLQRASSSTGGLSPPSCPTHPHRRGRAGRCGRQRRRQLDAGGLGCRGAQRQPLCGNEAHHPGCLGNQPYPKGSGKQPQPQDQIACEGCTLLTDRHALPPSASAQLAHPACAGMPTALHLKHSAPSIATLTACKSVPCFAASTQCLRFTRSVAARNHSRLGQRTVQKQMSPRSQKSLQAAKQV